MNDGRYQTGSALLAALLALASIAATSNDAGLMWVFILLGVALLLATFAPALPMLHRLPKVGAPRVEFRLTIEGSANLEAAGPGTLLVRLGVFHNSWRDLERTRITVLVPRTVDIEAADFHGMPQMRGTEQPDTSEQLLPGIASRVWQEKADIPSGWTIMHYAMRFQANGHYPVRIKVTSRSLWRGGFYQDHQINVGVPADG